MKIYFLIIAAIGSARACQFPPHLWCSSLEIATQCKVISQCERSVWSNKLKEDAPPVALELYYESLCPDCQAFITTQLYPTYQKVGNIMNITLVPYGNAEETHDGDKWLFTCQHGEQECIGNLLETCAIHIVQHIEIIMPFIDCMEHSREPLQAVKLCAQKQSIPLDPIMSCFNSSLGNQLEHQMALKTEALKPKHEYVPWIVLNGVHTEEINDEAVEDLLKLICKTYTGPAPSACSVTKAKISYCARYSAN